MERSGEQSDNPQSIVVGYCDRCARRASTLLFDDLSLQDLCQECWERLKRKREMAFRPVNPKL
jgi:hypothetical protein